MIEKIVKKLWRGKYVDIRDYEIPRAIKKGGMVVYYKGAYMKLSVDDLQKLKPTGKEIQSKYKGTYRLCSIKWLPKSDDEKQTKLF